MESKAIARYVRIAPRKVRLVADLIKGQAVSKALNILKFNNKKSAFYLIKTIKSAVANAGNKEGVNVDNLFIKSAFINEGPMLKRFMPRAMGRATRIRKRTSHITIILDEKQSKEQNKKQNKKPQAEQLAAAGKSEK